ncbi:unnamed protein product [Closterium sp. Naga37s-1]|nr:unnamed protein product [Closterium sp. Naga37s-1]
MTAAYRQKAFDDDVDSSAGTRRTDTRNNERRRSEAPLSKVPLSEGPQSNGRDNRPPSDLFNGDAEPVTYQPLIGVLSQPGIADSGEIARVFNATEENHFANLSYIAASYVKFIEAGGARVVPIIYNEPRRQILKKLRLVNGLVLPGGDANKRGRFLRTVRRLLKMAMSFNDNGDYFPIYAECLSFEMLTIILSTGGRKVLEPTNAKRPSTLQFVGEWAKDRNMFAWMRRRLVDRLEKENLTMENHKYGLTPETFNADEGLSSFFNILTTTADEDGKEYISTVEAKRYPFTALQWHPEKNAYEWGNPIFPHSSDAVQITHAAGTFFASEARKSSHKPRALNVTAKTSKARKNSATRTKQPKRTEKRVSRTNGESWDATSAASEPDFSWASGTTVASLGRREDDVDAEGSDVATRSRATRGLRADNKQELENAGTASVAAAVAASTAVLEAAPVVREEDKAGIVAGKPAADVARERGQDEEEEEEEGEEEEEEEEWDEDWEEEEEGEEEDVRVELWEGDLPPMTEEEERELLLEAEREIAELEAEKLAGVAPAAGRMVDGDWLQEDGEIGAEAGREMGAGEAAREEGAEADKGAGEEAGGAVVDMEGEIAALRRQLADMERELAEAKARERAQAAIEGIREQENLEPRGFASEPSGRIGERKAEAVSVRDERNSGSVSDEIVEGEDEEDEEEEKEENEDDLSHLRRKEQKRLREEMRWLEGKDEEEWEGNDASSSSPASDAERRGLQAVMRCFDTARVFIKAGDGGDGIVAFRREKFVPDGGPSGGNGGRGGNVIITADPALNSLLPFRRSVHFRATRGAHGKGSNRHGEAGRDIEIKVPPGTIVREVVGRGPVRDWGVKNGGEEWAEGEGEADGVQGGEGEGEGRALLELVRVGQSEVLLAGGRGGRGNAAFKTGRTNAPQIAEKGEEGPEMWVQLELRVVADVGIVGAPNAGKSTLLAAISAARPKVANYPFTTLVPNLGVVAVPGGFDSMVWADVPGLLEGAHVGRGLGHQFLRHTDRCRVLIHVIDGSSPQPYLELQAVTRELALFSPSLASKPRVIVFNKMDLPDAQHQWGSFQEAVRELGLGGEGEEDGTWWGGAEGEGEGEGEGVKGPVVLSMSAVTGQGTQEVVRAAYGLLKSVQGESDGWGDEGEEEAPNTTRQRLGLAAEVQRARRAAVNEFRVAFDGHTRVFEVTGEGIERFVQMTNWEYFEAVRRFAHVLDASGINEALRARGVREGDTVVIGQLEFTWRESDDIMEAVGGDWKRGIRGSKLWPH